MDAKPRLVEQSLFGVESVIATAYEHHVGNLTGAIADYIPELAAVDPNKFGIAVATESGTLEFRWTGDNGYTASHTASIKVV